MMDTLIERHPAIHQQDNSCSCQLTKRALITRYVFELGGACPGEGTTLELSCGKP